MPRELPVEQPGPPAFAVKVDGQALEQVDRERIVRLDVHEEVGKLARASLLVRHWDDTQNTVVATNTTTFAPGKPVEIQLGYGSNLETVFDGVVTGLRAVFRSNREPQLEVICRCRGILLCGARRSRVLADSTDGDLVSTIAGAASLTPDNEDGASQTAVVQADLADWDMLLERARVLGYALYVRGTSLVFKPPATSGSPAITLQWGANLVEIDLEQDVGLRAETVVSAGWDPDAVEAATSQAGAGEATVPHGSRPDVATALGDASFSGRTDRVASPAALTPDELDRLAKGEVDRGALGHLSGYGRAIGLPTLRCDSLLGLAGCGDRFDGPHYVSAVRHVLDPQGYSTEFQLGLPAELLPGGERASPRLQLALGVVDDIDDPNGWGGVKVVFPWLDPDVEGIWARLALPAAGAERGFFFIPEVGDEVVVGWVGEDRRHPVVLGSLWNGQAAPPESLDAQTNAIREIASRSGHKLTFDDSDGAGMIVITSSGSQTVTIDDTSGSETIALADKTGNKITLDSQGITLEAASSGNITLKASGGKVGIDAMQLEGKASASAKLQSSATLDLEASAALSLTGGLVKINS
jgi:phage protein D